MKDYQLYRKLEEMTDEERAELGIPAETDAKDAAEPITLSDAVSDFQRSLDEPAEPSVPTHLSALNWKLDGGFGPGELVYLAARAGVGKTSLALQFVTSAARAGFRTLVSSHEMLTMALCRRLVSQVSDVSASQLKRKELNDIEVRRVTRACAELGNLPVWIMDSARTVEEIRAVCDGMRLTSEGFDFVVIDYLQRIQSPDSQRERRIQVEHTSNSLKSLAQELRIPVLCLSAVSRPAKGQSTRPTMESLKESSNLEHDADVILLLDRDVQETEATLLVAKARDGDTGPVDLEFVAQNVRFVEADGS